MRDTCSVSRQAHTQQYHTHIAHHSVRAFRRGGWHHFRSPPPRCSARTTRAGWDPHIRYTTRATCSTCTSCSTCVTNASLSCVHYAHSGKPRRSSSDMQDRRTANNVCVCVCVCVCVLVFGIFFFVGGDCVGGLILFAECTWGHTETSQFQGGVSTRLV